MLEKQTTFIVGAGACADILLPTGPELRKKVSEILRFQHDFGRLVSGDHVVERAIRKRAGDDLNEYFGAASYIAEEVLLARSIDDFIDANRHDAAINFCGKLAIARCILKAERSSKLFVNSDHGGQNGIPIDRLESSWFAELFRIIQVPKSDVGSIFENVDFVIFNYDRCVEHFFFHAVRRLYRLSEGEAAEVMATANIHHPYGRLGSLPWMRAANGPRLAFGSEINSEELIAVADSLKTYTERVEDSEELGRIKGRILDADKMVFLGFAFHRQNMKLLKPNSDLFARRVYGTAYKFAPTEQELAHNQIASFCGRSLRDVREVHLEDAPCDKLIRDYARAIQYA